MIGIDIRKELVFVKNNSTRWLKNCKTELNSNVWKIAYHRRAEGKFCEHLLSLVKGMQAQEDKIKTEEKIHSLAKIG